MEVTTKNTHITGFRIVKTYRILSSKVKIKVLDGMSFGFQPGLTLLTGKNGSGKSTLLKLLAGVVKPSSGYVIVKGSVGYYPQNPQFNKGVSVQDFTDYLGSLKTKHYSKMEGKTWLNNFGITDKWKNMDILLLSEGMRRRVALALAFLGNPDIILLDEPLENLDIDIKEKFILLLQEQLEKNKLIVIASHEPEVFTKFNPKRLNLEKGKDT